MEKDICKFINSFGIDILLTDKYIKKHCYDIFKDVYILSNTRSAISSSIGFKMFGLNSICYLDNFFEFLFIYDNCYKQVNLNLLVMMDEEKLPNYLDRGVLSNYGISYTNINNYKNNSSLHSCIKDSVKNNGCGFIINTGGKGDD